jgi:valyl-tRNA synthetase
MIRKYGTDALRFSIISITAQGQDVFLSENKFELGRNFANKLWNASRFILMNLKEEDINVDLCVFFKESELALSERWILSRLYSTLDNVEKCLGEYKFNEAANIIYEFIWHEFCDWYIEIAKSTITEKSVQVVLYKVLEKSLRMLHPFMPFITEEIWQKLPRSKDSTGDSIMIQPWPHIQKDIISDKAESDMKCLIGIITAIRNIRSVWNIPPAREMSALINIHNKKDEAFLNENAGMINRLSRLSSMKAGKCPKPKNSAASVVETFEVYVPLEGIIDFDKEKARLKKEEDRIALEIKSIGARLKDKHFTSKAPEDVIEKQRVRKADLELQVKKLKDNLKNIG